MIDLDVLDALYAGTTDGEWRVIDDDDGPGGSRWVWVYGTQEQPIILDYMKKGDGNFCAAVRNAWPNLSQRVRDLEQSHAAITAERDRLMSLLCQLAIGIAPYSDGFGYRAKHDAAVVHDLYATVDPFLATVRAEILAAGKEQDE